MAALFTPLYSQKTRRHGDKTDTPGKTTPPPPPPQEERIKKKVGKVRKETRFTGLVFSPTQGHAHSNPARLSGVFKRGGVVYIRTADRHDVVSLVLFYRGGISGWGSKAVRKERNEGEAGAAAR